METTTSSKMKKPTLGLDKAGQLTRKRLLFIGADSTKAFTWDVASEVGIECYVIGTIPEDAFQYKVARYLFYDTTNHLQDQEHCDVITDFVASELGDVDGCLTLWDDCIPLTALVCEKLGKVGLHYAGATAANHKSLTFLELKNSGKQFPSVANYTSQCWRISKLEDVEEAAQMVGFPAVLKTDSGAGSMSTRVVHNIKETAEHFQFLQKLTGSSRERHFMMCMGTGFHFECALFEYLQGSEHCVDMALYHGELLAVFLTDKGPQLLPDTFHTVIAAPSQLPVVQQRQVVRLAFQCCLALGLQHGLFNVDVMMTSFGPKLIEINCRMGGYRQRDLILLCYGVDLVHLACTLACDIKPQVLYDLSPFQNGDCLEAPEASTTSNSEGGLSPHFLPLKPQSVIVGLALHPWRHRAALKAKARPEILQRLHEEGELLFLNHKMSLKAERHAVPYCTVAIQDQSVDIACRRLQQLCRKLDIEAPELGVFLSGV